jgi:hypothetical protein
MKKYNIESNINFYEELFKSLDDDDTVVQSKLCQITSMPLTDNHVTLECNHQFNYLPLYKEICNQKLKFKTYELTKLCKKDQEKVKASGLDYYIKCPYCRNIQFTILPYYEELGLHKVYGINSTNAEANLKTNDYSIIYDQSYMLYGREFKYGKCCSQFHNPNIGFLGEYVATIPNTDKAYCRYHYRDAEKQHKSSEKQQLLDTMNATRVANGLKPLKHLKQTQNQNLIVQATQTIGTYIPEEGITNNTCKAVLKTGANKGSPCGSKIHSNGLCKRHCKKEIHTENT